VVYRTFLLLFFCLSTVFSFGQIVKPCGTAPYKDPWLKAYQQRSPAAQSRGNQDSVIYLPMTVHSVGKDDGGGHFGTVKILDAFCQLNADYLESNMQFYLTEDIRLINNSAIYEHDSIYLAGLFMLENDVPNTLNTYIVNNPAGNCGYNLPWASMTVAKLCAGKNGHTWAHEVGHHFTIQHPFLGWERGVSYDNSIEPDFSQPAPEYVLYNYTIFKDQPFVDTIIVDTAFVEKVDGSNCQIAADGFCDTAPDYLSGRWECNNGVSRTLQTDPNGTTFRSNASLIMSNSEEGCASRFTPQQMAAMRAYVLEQRQDLFATPFPIQEPVAEVPSLLYPIAGENAPVNQLELAWEVVPHATRYIIQVSRLSTFPEGLTTTYETDQTTLLVNDLVTERNYHWRVRPYNAFYTCTDFSAAEEFEVVESVTSIASIEGLMNMQLLPTVQKTGNSIQLLLETNRPLSGNLKVINAVGGTMYSEKYHSLSNTTTFQIPTHNLPSGVYFVGIETVSGFVFEKIVLN